MDKHAGEDLRLRENSPPPDGAGSQLNPSQHIYHGHLTRLYGIPHHFEYYIALGAMQDSGLLISPIAWWSFIRGLYQDLELSIART